MEIIKKNFRKYKDKFGERLSRVVKGMIKGGKANTNKIAEEIARADNIKVDSAWMFVHRLLSDKLFQIDDKFWRCHFKTIFCLLTENKMIKSGGNIQINVDFTTIKDNFLILVASVNIAGEKDVLLYFSSRSYPKKPGRMDQKKMELAFFKELKHLLPKKYTYTIVADRGFGNIRTIETCQKCGFNFVLRINPELWIKSEDGSLHKLAEFQGKNSFFKAEVLTWGQSFNFEIKTKNNSTWYLVTNLETPDLATQYEMRFKIEKLFQDLKSYGFDIEQLKIRKYDRMKRVFYLAALCHALASFLGCFVKYCKKKIYKSLGTGFSLYIVGMKVFGRKSTTIREEFWQSVFL
jgi:hypothetical protein